MKTRKTVEVTTITFYGEYYWMGLVGMLCDFVQLLQENLRK